jgi:KUP system potassium uptake protein
MTATSSETGSHSDPSPRKRLIGLSIAALGVVYGDIGTSPLYAFKESMHSLSHHGLPPSVFGVLSLILWALILIVSIKYIVFILKADHRGEGGILALVGLLFDRAACKSPLTGKAALAFTLLGILGAALLYGDGMITPAISVLSAMEGLGYAAPQLQPLIVPASVAVLLGLFIFQKIGTGKVGAIFGPIMLIWFAFLAVVGVWNLVQAPEVLAALNPLHGIEYLLHHGFHGFLVLGSVFLAVTGAEALYADMGHFGKRPIRLGWHTIVLPALALNYLGQGAVVLRDPTAIENPFYATVPPLLLFPTILLATVATVIASQALISGVFSLTLQAMYLGYCPRMTVSHTSHHERGQIYIPHVNWGLMAACIFLVLEFRTSGALASAYGIAVTLTMLLTTALFAVISHKVLKWPMIATVIFTLFFGIIEFGFFFANTFKILHGGWFALLMAGIIFVLMTTWKTGRDALYARLKPGLIPAEKFIDDIKNTAPKRVKGSAVFLTSTGGVTPLALLNNVHHNKVLHQTIILISVTSELRAYLDPEEETIKVEDLGAGFYSVTARFGYMETPNVPFVISLLPDYNVPLDPTDITYFLSRERIVPAHQPVLAPVRRMLFSFLARNATSPADFFCLPPGRVVELGVQVEC